VKFNCVYRHINTTPSPRSFTCYTVFGALDDVKSGIQALYRYFHAATTTP
jgi:hypothetical protein